MDGVKVVLKLLGVLGSQQGLAVTPLLGCIIWPVQSIVILKLQPPRFVVQLPAKRRGVEAVKFRRLNKSVLKRMRKIFLSHRAIKKMSFRCIIVVLRKSLLLPLGPQ